MAKRHQCKQRKKPRNPTTANSQSSSSRSSELAGSIPERGRVDRKDDWEKLKAYVNGLPIPRPTDEVPRPHPLTIVWGPS